MDVVVEVVVVGVAVVVVSLGGAGGRLAGAPIAFIPSVTVAIISGVWPATWNVQFQD